MKLNVAWLWLPLLMMGCATQADTEWADASAKQDACSQQLASTPQARPLTKKFLTGDNDPLAILKMADINLASAQDKIDLIEYRAVEAPCITTIIAEYGKIHPAYAVVLGLIPLSQVSLA